MCTRRTTSAPPRQTAGRRQLPGVGSWAPQLLPQATPRAAASGTQSALSPAQPHPHVEQMPHLRPHYRTPGGTICCSAPPAAALPHRSIHHSMLSFVASMDPLIELVILVAIFQWQHITAISEKHHTTCRQASLYHCTPSRASSSPGTLPPTS